MSRVVVLGAGSWGTVLAHHLAAQGLEVTLWARDPELAQRIDCEHRNERYFPAHPLCAALRATAELPEAVAGRDVIVSAVPSQTVRDVLRRAAPVAGRDAIVVSASKGIESDSLKRISEVVADVLPGRPFAVLSGPSFALEVLQGQPTAVVAASASEAAAGTVQTLFTAATFRVYTSGDVVGTELAGAFKNVIAIAAGMCEGLGLGSNPHAALVTRGLAEISRLGVAFGADPLTFAGLAGVGDLVLTTGGALSRNRALGVALGRGETLAGFAARQHSVVEGVPTARVALRLAERAGVELPIAAQVAECLFQGKSPRRAIAELMERTPKPEQWT